MTKCPCCQQEIQKDTKLTETPRMVIQRAARAVELIHGVTMEQIESQSRRPVIVTGRNMFWFILSIQENWSWLKTSVASKSSNHTTAIYGVRRHSAQQYGTGEKATQKEMRNAYKEATKRKKS